MAEHNLHRLTILGHNARTHLHTSDGPHHHLLHQKETLLAQLAAVFPFVFDAEVFAVAVVEVTGLLVFGVRRHEV